MLEMVKPDDLPLLDNAAPGKPLPKEPKMPKQSKKGKAGKKQ